MKSQGNMTSTKDHNNAPITKPKEIAIWDLLDKELKIGCFVEIQ